jgi:hypothetical protein
MNRKTLTVKDGPLEGQVYELALDPDEETSLRLSDGRVAVYRVSPDPDYPDSTGHTVRCLRFVGMDPAE